MNHLAHLLLSHGYQELTIGNLLADFMSPKEQKALPSGIFKGIILHRSIDYYADNHPEVKASRALIRPQQGKYTPVVMDIYYDHLLVRHWHLFARDRFEDFQEEVYTLLGTWRSELPSALWPRIKRMSESRWLNTYATLPGLDTVFRRLQTQLKYSNQVLLAVSHLQDHNAELDEHFLIFWPQLAAMAGQKIQALMSNEEG